MRAGFYNPIIQAIFRVPPRSNPNFLVFVREKYCAMDSQQVARNREFLLDYLIGVKDRGGGGRNLYRVYGRRNSHTDAMVSRAALLTRLATISPSLSSAAEAPKLCKGPTKGGGYGGGGGRSLTRLYQGLVAHRLTRS